MRWKLFTAAAIGAVLMNIPMGWGVNAAGNTAYDEYEKAIGLIEKCTLSCSMTEDGFINISAKTQVASVMEEVGYKNVVIQHSDDGINWKDEQYLGDFIGRNTRYYSINNMKVKVGDDGGEYRVVCDHYAKGVPYGERQTRTQIATNSSAWSAQPIITSAPPSYTEPTTTTSVTVALSTAASSSTAASTSSKASSTSVRNTSTKAASTTAAAATAKTTTAANNNSPTTGAKAPLGAAAALIVSGGAAWILRKKK